MSIHIMRSCINFIFLHINKINQEEKKVDPHFKKVFHFAVKN